MKSANENLSDILANKGLKSSHQRLKILEYLANNPCHPTADKILHEMKNELPTLSKSTVYKTLNSFVEANLLRELTIEDREIRYEYNLEDHGHFKCEECGEVYDFKINFDIFHSKELEGFKVNDKNICFKGVCKSCLSNKN